MPDLKISQMPAADALAGTEAMPVVQGGENKHSTPAAIKSYIGDAVPTGDGQNDGLMTHEDKAKLDALPADIKAHIGDAAPTGANQNDGLMTHEDKAKLDGIEAGADVTDAANVAAAGAVMTADVDDTPVDGATAAPISSNWAFDHAANLNAHGISDFGETLVDDANAATARGTLGLGDSATKNVGTTSGTVAAGNDSRLSDARPPTAHKTSHATGGSDALTAADIGAAATGHDHAGVYQPADSDLDALAGLSTTGLIERTGAGTAGIVTVTTAGKAILDDADAAAQRTTLGVGTGDSPQFTAVNIGHASDTTLARVSAGVVSIEGVTVATASNTLTLTNKTLTDPVITGAIQEDVYTITDGAAFEIDPGNGTIQTITLGASRTPKATNFAAGESVTLMVLDGSTYTLTWTDATFGGSGVVWVGGTAPTLDTTKYTVVELWKVGSQVYGALVGAA